MGSYFSYKKLNTNKINEKAKHYISTLGFATQFAICESRSIMHAYKLCQHVALYMGLQHNDDAQHYATMQQSCCEAKYYALHNKQCNKVDSYNTKTILQCNKVD